MNELAVPTHNIAHSLVEAPPVHPAPLASVALGPVSIEAYPHITDTPDVYKPFMGAGVRYMNSVEELGQQMEALAADPNFNPGLIRTEETRLGVRFQDDPETFRQKHNTLLSDFTKYLEIVVPDVKERTLTQVSEYLGKGDAAATAAWRERLEVRLAGSHGTFALDHLRRSTAAYMHTIERSVRVNSAFSFLDMPSARHLIEDIIVPHELIHLMSTSAALEGGLHLDNGDSTRLPVRTGAATTHLTDFPEGEVTQAVWLNEAGTEDFRGRATGSTEFGYTRGLAVVRAVKELDPTLEATIDSTLFDRDAPVTLTTKMEDVLGPLGVNLIEPYVGGGSQVWNPVTRDIEDRYSPDEFVAGVQALALPHLRAKLGVALHRQLEQIVRAPGLPVGIRSMH